MFTRASFEVTEDSTTEIIDVDEFWEQNIEIGEKLGHRHTKMNLLKYFFRRSILTTIFLIIGTISTVWLIYVLTT